MRAASARWRVLLPMQAAAACALPGVANAAGVVGEGFGPQTFAVFGLVITLTILITIVAARRVRSADDFYTAGRGISGLQNGWAIAGDYLSAASFLGVAGLISLWGYDGYMYAVGWLVAYMSVLLVIAEPCRNIGKYTLADILAYRNDPRKMRIAGALSVITVSTFYLTAQMVGGGVLIKMLVGIDYEVSVIAVGVLMLGYVMFGGMAATTWVQIVKAVLLVASSVVLVVMLWNRYGYFGEFFDHVVASERVQARVAELLGSEANSMSAAALGQRFLEPGLLFKQPLDQISLGIALVFGTAGLPHILMRFFTVPTAQEARRSVAWAMVIIGGFYVLTVFLGMGAAIMVGTPAITATDAGGNMAAPLLAQYLGGGPNSLVGNFMLAFVAAVAFATIVAVVAGLVLASASAMAHDLYVGVVKGGHATPHEQVRAARLATAVVGALAIIIGIAAKGQNVAHLVALAFAVAASANFPAIFLTLFWRPCTTGGIIAGMVVGSVTAIGLVLVSPTMTYPKEVRAAAQAVLAEEAAEEARLAAMLADPDIRVQEAARRDAAVLVRRLDEARTTLSRLKDDQTSIIGLEAPLFPLNNPGLVSVPLGFLAVILGSLLFRDPRADAMWNELHVRKHTGILAARAVKN